ncbi:LytTR family transcriptional regulator DNA-binding domain-containing protein [Paenibacillus abyssi]|uniref:HTH LytTR-type domain-containing protein n=1 Tax=Paenibacillus abyssi TaxID=1340531 RepID=A0A917CTJ3_9BACL|nr:LytTR family transcriptional regulator DNA-binding domain-containing protein [Paenibacillus abyssi]GGF97361.1 hypothetical protein GCM10010916_13250 [Paenibacillus abyssi]
MKIPLLNASNQCELVDIEQLVMLKPTSKGPELISLSDSYRYPSTTVELLAVFGELGFCQLDRNNLVNMNLVHHYDPLQRKVYFQENTAAGVYATVSVTNVHKLKPYIREAGASYWIDEPSDLYMVNQAV